jgi:DNA modification methylase
MKKTVTKTSTAKLGDLIPDARNANKGTDRGRKLVTESIREFGTGRSILLDKNNRIIAGNKTAAGAAVLDDEDVLIVDTDGTKLVALRRTDLDLEHDPRAKALAIADNRTGELGLEWDQANLQAQIDEAEGKLRAFFTDGELEKLLGSAGDTRDVPEAKLDQAEELRAKWKTDRGQIWTVPSKNCAGHAHRIACGDSTNQEDVRRLMGNRVVALVNTDPPYGVDYNSKATGAIAGDGKGANALADMLIGSLGLAAKHSAPAAAFYIWHASSTRRDFEYAMDAVGLEEKQYICWAKDSFVLGRADYHWQTEPCFYAQKAGHKAAYYGTRDQATLWRIRTGADGQVFAIANGLHILSGREVELYVSERVPKNRKLRQVRVLEGKTVTLTPDAGASDCWSVGHEKQGTLHPTQKPTELAARAIRNSTIPGDAVYDPFGGAGFTVCAAEQLGRYAMTSDLDPKFTAVMLERLQDMGLRPKLEQR